MPKGRKRCPHYEQTCSERVGGGEGGRWFSYEDSSVVQTCVRTGRSGTLRKRVWQGLGGAKGAPSDSPHQTNVHAEREHGP